MARMHYTFDSSQLDHNIQNLPRKIDRAIRATMDYTGIETTAVMKERAPWTDRTGAARAGLHVTNDFRAPKYALILSGTVPYQIWLEIANSGRYAIIAPTVHTQGTVLMLRLRNILSSIQ